MAKTGCHTADGKTMKILRLILTGLLMAQAGCAAGIKATHDHDANHDFTGYQTYAWIAESPMRIGEGVTTPNPLLEGRIMAAVERALSAKGYRKIDAATDADFVVSFTIGSRESIKVDSYPSMSMGYSTGYPGHWAWGASYYCCQSETRVRQYRTGVLAIDVFDVEARRPVWHGVASKRLESSDRLNMEATVNAAVDAILDAFPPG